MARPLVSVVLPTTGCPWLPEAVRSVLSQTMPDLELIIVDAMPNADFDVATFSDNRLRVLKLPRWPGIAGARNAGNALAKGEFIAVIDHDDLWLPTKLERQLPHLLGSPNLGMCHTQFEHIDSAGRVTGPGLSHDTSPGAVLSGKPGGVCHSSTLWRRAVVEQVGGYDKRYPFAEDLDLLYKVMEVSDVFFEATVQVRHRVHQNNASRNYRPQYASFRNIVHEHLPLLVARAGQSALTKQQLQTVDRAL